MLMLHSLGRRCVLPPARRPAMLAAAVAASLGLGATAAAAAPKDYVVLYDRGGSHADARAAVRAAGGRVLRMNAAVGLMTARAAGPRFAARVARAEVVDGVARNRVIGRAPAAGRKFDPADRDHGSGARYPGGPPASLNPVAEPFSTVQWDMGMIDADFSGSYRYQQGTHDVLAGVIDTGI